MWKYVAVAAIAVGVAIAPGCKRKKNLDGRLDELGEIRITTCACKDEPCLEYQYKLLDAWHMRNDSTDLKKATPDQQQRYMKLYEELEGCAKRMAAGVGHADGSDGSGAP